MIAGIVVATGQIQSNIRSIGERGIAPPIERKRCGQIAGTLRIVKEEGFLEHFGIVVGAGEYGIVVDDRAGAGAIGNRGR